MMIKATLKYVHPISLVTEKIKSLLGEIIHLTLFFTPQTKRMSEEEATYYYRQDKEPAGRNKSPDSYGYRSYKKNDGRNHSLDSFGYRRDKETVGRNNSPHSMASNGARPVPRSLLQTVRKLRICRNSSQLKWRKQ